MPPCAHTEWMRLTGTIEKRSTSTPISAARILAIRPARPPPTTMTRSRVTTTRSRPKGLNRPDADEGEDQEDRGRHPHHAALRLRSHGQPPDDRERPDAVGEVEGRGHDPEDVERVDPRAPNGVLHQPVEVDALVVLQIDEPGRPEVKDHAGE